MEQKSEAGQPASPADKYAILADEIRGLSHNVTDSLLKVLLELGKSNRGDVYVASKKYLEQSGFLLADEGYVGIADRFVSEENGEYLVCPADVVVYVTVGKLMTGDVLLAFYFDKGSVWFYHCRVLGFDPRGSVEVQDFGDNKAYWISPERILGKLAKVAHFGDPEWHQLIGQMVTKKYLVDSLTKRVKQLEEGSLPDKSRRYDELRRRLTILTADYP